MLRLVLLQKQHMAIYIERISVGRAYTMNGRAVGTSDWSLSVAGYGCRRAPNGGVAMAEGVITLAGVPSITYAIDRTASWSG